MEVILEQEEKENPNWADIPQDILEVIAGCMNLGDLIQTSRACKKWRCLILCMAPNLHPAASSSSSYYYGTPCILRRYNQNKRCTLTDPLRHEHFIIDTPTLPDDVYLECSGHGWLLLIRCWCAPGVVFFFFNPLTRMTIELPKLESAERYKFFFSSSPTSPDCFIVGLSYLYGVSTILVCYCRLEEGRWTTFQVNHQEIQFNARWFVYPLYAKGLIYHLDGSLRLVVYDIFHRTLTVVGEEPPRIEQQSNVLINFLEMDDKIMLALKAFNDAVIHLYEFDSSKNKWIEMESVGERLVFFCPTNCISMKAPLQGEGGRVYVWKDRPQREIVSYSYMSHDDVRIEKRFEHVDEELLDSFWNRPWSTHLDVCWI